MCETLGLGLGTKTFLECMWGKREKQNGRVRNYLGLGFEFRHNFYVKKNAIKYRY
uniref:Uncharacterized protein n=1 Tax=Meloidogyne enterolobii TaxID=390850 RepID=A0A6V7Y0H1_MELEN|nr:unnamed protein product [Meloidogyne enterolobii]